MQIFPPSQNVNRVCAVAASIVVLLLLPLPADLSSQEVVDSLQGRRVRLTLKGSPPNATRVGTLWRVDSLSLALRTRQGVIALVPRMQVLRVEVSDSDRSKRALQGLGIGAAVGSVAYKVWADHHSIENELNTLGAVILGMPVGAFVGFMVGAALGRERWLPVYLDTATSPGLLFGMRLTLPR